MNPAYSVIFFTTASGAGYGLLFWLGMLASGDNLPPEAASLAGLGLALILVTAGLLASTAHLGHPERAWRALSQWRSSWLSREGVLAMISYLPALALAAGLWFVQPTLMRTAGAATALMALATVYSTAMIYASLRPIPRWNNPWVPAVYLGFSLASGGVLLLALWLAADFPRGNMGLWVTAALVAAWLLKLTYWRSIDRAKPVATSATATGLDEYGSVRLFSSPHTEANFVQKEMGYRVARKHAATLRRLSLIGATASVSLVLATRVYEDWLALLWAVLAVAVTLVAVVIERWLFFAEARHVVNLYYGDTAV